VKVLDGSLVHTVTHVKRLLKEYVRVEYRLALKAGA
jgi:hypothetical protein